MYEKAFEKTFEFEDEKAWLYGRYTYTALEVMLFNVFKKKHEKSAEYPDKPFSQHVEQREMTKEEFDALSQAEQERITMQAWENAMADTLAGFNRMKSEDEQDG